MAIRALYPVCIANVQAGFVKATVFFVKLRCAFMLLATDFSRIVSRQPTMTFTKRSEIARKHCGRTSVVLRFQAPFIQLTRGHVAGCFHKDVSWAPFHGTRTKLD